MNWHYRIPPGVQLVSPTPRPLVSTPQGGRIALDSRLLSLWEYANGKEFNDILLHFTPNSEPIVIRAALACLAEAGLLTRDGQETIQPSYERVNGNLVSVVIVSYNSHAWLEDCLASLASQTYSPIEIIVVDNASLDGSADWVEKNHPQIRLVRLPETRSLAFAINQGIQIARGKYFLLLNPDVSLAPNAIGEMVNRANENPHAAAIAPKLKHSLAPSFLNGLGNYVGAFYWSTDNGLGHLDLGQFDGLDEIPSACFAATLILRSAWDAVGSLDEDFPLYYEDTEWCYRARLFGYAVLAAPKAIVYHAMGGHQAQESAGGLNPLKLRAVVYGRLRFAAKLLNHWLLLRFMMTYVIEDIASSIIAICQLRLPGFAARVVAWKSFLASVPSLFQQRKLISKKRTLSDYELVHLDEGIQPPLTWRGVPELTWDLVCWHYLPLFISRRTRPVPEFHEQDVLNLEKTGAGARKGNHFARTRLIWQTQGLSGLAHRFWRYVQWQLLRI